MDGRETRTDFLHFVFAFYMGFLLSMDVLRRRGEWNHVLIYFRLKFAYFQSYHVFFLLKD